LRTLTTLVAFATLDDNDGAGPAATTLDRAGISGPPRQLDSAHAIEVLGTRCMTSQTVQVAPRCTYTIAVHTDGYDRDIFLAMS
jgi:hypothetical protein